MFFFVCVCECIMRATSNRISVVSDIVFECVCINVYMWLEACARVRVRLPLYMNVYVLR